MRRSRTACISPWTPLGARGGSRDERVYASLIGSVVLSSMSMSMSVLYYMCVCTPYTQCCRPQVRTWISLARVLPGRCSGCDLRGGWNVDCHRRTAIPLLCPQRYGLRAELQLAGAVEGNGTCTAVAELPFPSPVPSDTVSEPSLELHLQLNLQWRPTLRERRCDA